MERPSGQREIQGFESPVDVDTAAQFLGASPSLAYSGRVVALRGLGNREPCGSLMLAAACRAAEIGEVQ
jgi:hypothetical protein